MPVIVYTTTLLVTKIQSFSRRDSEKVFLEIEQLGSSVPMTVDLSDRADVLYNRNNKTENDGYCRVPETGSIFTP